MSAHAASLEKLPTHFAAVADAFASGRVTPVLGAGASLFARPTLVDEAWLGRYPPSARELALYLARRVQFPPSGEPPSLLEVCQYASALNGVQALYDHLHAVFDVDFRPSPLHVLLATMPSRFRQKSASSADHRCTSPRITMTFSRWPSRRLGLIRPRCVHGRRPRRREGRAPPSWR